MAALKTIKPMMISLVFLFALAFGLQARTSLVSLPDRQDAAIRLQDREGAALVQEKRRLTLKKGINHIDFSWQNVMIDPSSILLAPLSHPDKIILLSVSYPPAEAALVWEISSPEDLEEEVMISYLLSNIDGIVAYQALADTKETVLELRTYLVLRNFSGEPFNPVTAHTSLGPPFTTPIQNLETKKILVSRNPDIPIKKIYTWDALTMPHEPEKSETGVGIPVSYELTNQKASKLGNFALRPGKTRLFQQDNQGSTIFLGEDTTSFTPMGGKTRLHIGDSRDIVVTKHRLDAAKTNVRRNSDGQVQVYDETVKEEILMENLKDGPVTLSIVETLPGHWEKVDISSPYTLKDHQTLIFAIDLPAKAKKTLTLNYKVLNIFAANFSEFNGARD
ncbi:MAG: hypothetical protein A3J85_03235 [Desulfobacula sp. RIFOXYA12_FULL_46_16]|nr:MAG: hypothetical protein A3J85_03235 [Desulfobacula sp. RIFOXYA12_FULL_46_16]